MMFFLVKDLTKLEHVYQFSLKWFMNLFETELRDKIPVPGHADPVIDLINRLTKTIYKTIYKRLCLSVFQKDKILISFMMAYKLMNSEAQVNLNHIKFFIKGPFQKQTTQGMTQREKDEMNYKAELNSQGPGAD